MRDGVVTACVPGPRSFFWALGCDARCTDVPRSAEPRCASRSGVPVRFSRVPLVPVAARRLVGVAQRVNVGLGCRAIPRCGLRSGACISLMACYSTADPGPPCVGPAHGDLHTQAPRRTPSRVQHRGQAPRAISQRATTSRAHGALAARCKRERKNRTHTR
ncbi:hypothetical protein BC834DRAFT_910047 [Gloeopeniophorella convolvens]|nr:hypothetical protein BC834DRAFT_910047 [Gloeopeniophorella convolvens]